MAFHTAVVIASRLIGLGGLARESFAQYYPPQAYPPARDYQRAHYAQAIADTGTDLTVKSPIRHRTDRLR